MVVINGKVFAIVPFNDPVMLFMTEFNPDHVELITFDIMYEVHRTTATVWGMSLKTAEMSYKGKAVWVCPD